MDDKRRPAAGFLLDASTVDSLRTAVERLRETGLTNQEAASELVRQNVYDWLDGEPDVTRSAPTRLRPRRKTST